MSSCLKSLSISLPRPPKTEPLLACRDPGLFRVQSPYEFPEKGPKTHKWLYVQRGTSPRLMPMHLVSNHGVTPEEFESWRSQCEKDNRPQITTAEVDEVKERLHKAQT